MRLLSVCVSQSIEPSPEPWSNGTSYSTSMTKTTVNHYLTSRVTVSPSLNKFFAQKLPAHASYTVLPSSRNDVVPSAMPPADVTKVALRLKYQIEQVIPCELEEWKITKANSPVITAKVVRLAKEAGGKDHEACVVYCLLVCYRWFKTLAAVELWDADLHNVRATACEILAKKMYGRPFPPPLEKPNGPLSFHNHVVWY